MRSATIASTSSRSPSQVRTIVSSESPARRSMYSRWVGGVAWRASTSAVTASITCSSSERVPLKSKISARKGMAEEPSDRGYSARHDRPTDPRRRPAAASAGHAREDAGDLAAGGGDGRGHRVQLGSLPPAVRRSGRPALRVLDGAGGDGGVDQPHPDRLPGHLQLLPQREPAGRHGAHRRPHLRRALHLRHRRRLVPARLRRVRLRVRHGARPAAPPRPLAGRRS